MFKNPFLQTLTKHFQMDAVFRIWCQLDNLVSQYLSFYIWPDSQSKFRKHPLKRYNVDKS